MPANSEVQDLLAKLKVAQATKQAQTDSDSGLQHVNTQFVQRALSEREKDACRSCVSRSKYSKLTLLPNHSINLTGELTGFKFECSKLDLANVLPMTRESFSTTAVYECSYSHDNRLPYLTLASDVAASAARLRAVIQEIQDNDTKSLRMSVMPDSSLNTFQDAHDWTPSVPCKVGLYHCFMRTHAHQTREHKVFIIVSGHVRYAAEELYNLWLDTNDHISAQEFCESAEVEWLRKVTVRHHNRVAAKVASAFKISGREIVDMEAVGSTVSMLLPTTYTVSNDVLNVADQVVLTSQGVYLPTHKTGVLFDCCSSEGFWVFTGPQNTSASNLFGSNFRVLKPHQVFPTCTVKYHEQYKASSDTNVIALQHDKRSIGSKRQSQITLVADTARKFTHYLFPHVKFVELLEHLGFDRNNGISNLMPIVTHVADE